MNSPLRQHTLPHAPRYAAGATLILSVFLFAVSGFKPALLGQSSAGCGLDVWNTSEALVTVWLRDVAYDASRGFVAVGDAGVILTSVDGQHWLPHYQPSSIGFAQVRHEGGLYLALGQQFGAAVNTWSAALWTSPDGITWTPRYDAPDTVVTSLAAGNGQLIALANITVPGVGTTARSLLSSDGLQWTLDETISNRWMYDIAFGNGVFVAVGGNQIRISPDGVNWSSPPDISTLLTLQSVAFFQGQFIAVGGGGTILTSSDGQTWTSRTSGTTSFLAAVGPGNGVVAVAGDSGTVLTSPNGIDWTPRLNSRLDIRGIAYGADRFVAVGRYGAIYQSGAISECGGARLLIRRGTPTRIDLSGRIGAHLRVEYADQIRGTWNLLSDIASLPQSPYQVVDSTTSPTGQRFYRAVQLP